MSWVLVAALLASGARNPAIAEAEALGAAGARTARQAAALGRSFDAFGKNRWEAGVAAWMEAEAEGWPRTSRCIMARVLLGNPGIVSTDPLVLRLTAPEALGTGWATLWSGPCWPVEGALNWAGAWALQPDSSETREHLSRWLDLADAHQFELARDFRIPMVRRPSPGVEAGFLWLSAARIEFRAGKRDAARRCRDRAIRAAGDEGLPAGWSELVEAGPPWARALEEARRTLASSPVRARRLMLAACRSASRVRDGECAVDELLAETRRAFPDLDEVPRIVASIKWRCGRAMPMRSLWWALAAGEALERGEGQEAWKRLGAALELAHAVDPGPSDPTPALAAAQAQIAHPANEPAGEAEQAEADRLAGGPPIRLPPGRWLPGLLPHEAVGYALADRWAARAREAGDLRLLVRMVGEGGRALEGVAVFAERLLAQGRGLEAAETLGGHVSLESAEAGVELAVRAQTLWELAVRGETPPVLTPLVGRAAERTRFAVDGALLALFDGDGELAVSRLAAVPDEAVAHPAVLEVRLRIAQLGQETEAVDRALRAAAESGAASGRVLLARGKLGLAGGKLDQAIGDLREATTRFESAAPAWQILGRAYEIAGRREEAAAAFGHSWERQPCRAEPLEEMIRMLSPGARRLSDDRRVLAHRALALLITRRKWTEASQLTDAVSRLDSGGRRFDGTAPAPWLCPEAEEQCRRCPFDWRMQLDRGLASGSAEWLDKTIQSISGSTEAVNLALDFLGRGAYGPLAKLLVAAGQPRAGAGVQSAPAERPNDPLLGLKRDPEQAWTKEGSPFGGALTRSRRIAFRLALLGVVLVSWVRLHLYLIALFLPGGPFFRWLRKTVEG